MADDVERIVEIVNNLPDPKSRKLRMQPPSAFENDGAWYSWVINKWIVAQPDKEELMELFILVGLSMEAFIRFYYKKIDDLIGEETNENI